MTMRGISLMRISFEGCVKIDIFIKIRTVKITVLESGEYETRPEKT